jgi:hypothetical protein
MPDQVIQEFRDRAERLVTPPNPSLLHHRGRALRRRRQLAPILALAVCGAIGIGIATFVSDDAVAPRGIQPASPSPTTQPQALGETSEQLRPGAYTLDQLPQDGRADATVELVGEHWIAWSSGAHLENVLGTASWGVREYYKTIIDPCTGRHATTLEGAISQLSELPGRVTTSPRPVTALGLTGTYLQLSIPVDVTCRGETVSAGYLMAVWDGPQDPTVTVDVWLLQDGDRLLIMTKGVRGEPSPEMLDNLDQTLNTLRLASTR